MATNQYFNLHGTNTPEQRLIENLNIEAIKTFGMDVYYCPRTLNDEDTLMGEDNTALMKKQWGQNLTKFEGMQLPGGVTMNGRQLYDDATTELETIQTEMSLRSEIPGDHLIG